MLPPVSRRGGSRRRRGPRGGGGPVGLFPGACAFFLASSSFRFCSAARASSAARVSSALRASSAFRASAALRASSAAFASFAWRACFSWSARRRSCSCISSAISFSALTSCSIRLTRRSRIWGVRRFSNCFTSRSATLPGGRVEKPSSCLLKPSLAPSRSSSSRRSVSENFFLSSFVISVRECVRRVRDLNPHVPKDGSFQDCCHTIRRTLRFSPPARGRSGNPATSELI
jgi:hypothetical protein